MNYTINVTFLEQIDENAGDIDASKVKRQEELSVVKTAKMSFVLKFENPATVNEITNFIKSDFRLLDSDKIETRVKNKVVAPESIINDYGVSCIVTRELKK